PAGSARRPKAEAVTPLTTSVKYTSHVSSLSLVTSSSVVGRYRVIDSTDGGVRSMKYGSDSTTSGTSVLPASSVTRWWFWLNRRVSGPSVLVGLIVMFTRQLVRLPSRSWIIVTDGFRIPAG